VTLSAIPLFPLSTVLFPDGPLPLRVFEPRYLDMVSRCLRQDSDFGVVLIVSGKDTGQVDGLYLGDVELLPELPRQALPDEFRPLATLLASVIDDLGRLYDAIEKRYDDAAWVGCRLAEIVPMPPADKQRCLELTDPVELLQFLRPMLRPFRREKPK
jgi:Lon protease-like protein